MSSRTLLLSQFSTVNLKKQRSRVLTTCKNWISSFKKGEVRPNVIWGQSVYYILHRTKTYEEDNNTQIARILEKDRQFIPLYCLLPRKF